MDFMAWLEQQGCTVEITQEDDDSGYVCFEVIVPGGQRFDVTVTA